MENYLPTYEKILFEKAETTCGCEVTLPEYLPNITKVIRVSAKSSGSHTTVSDGAVLFEETVRFSLLYMSDYKDTMKSAQFSCNYSYSFKNDKNISFADCRSFLYDENATVLTGRKLALSCGAQVICQAFSCVQNEVFSSCEEESFQALKKQADVLNIIPLPSLNFRLDESISLEEGMPDASEIIFSDACVYIESKKVSSGSVLYSCRALWNCMYLCSGENEEYISLTKDIPFTVEGEAQDVSENAAIIAQASILGCNSDISQNSYGDSRIINLALSGDIRAKAYENSATEFCRDVFCTECVCECDMQEVPYDSLSGVFSERFSLDESAHANLGSMTEIIACDGEISSLHTERQEGKAIISGKLNVKLCGTTDGGNLDSADCVFPIKLAYSSPCDTATQKCVFDSSCGIASISCKIENGQVRCYANLICESALLARRNAIAVSNVRLDEENICRRNKSEYVIYYPTLDDTVWSVSKKYKVSPASLIAINDIEVKGDGKIGKKTLVIPR